MILLLAVIVLLLFHLSGWAAVVFLAAACVAEAAEIWGLRRWSKHLKRELPPQGPTEELVGLTGEVTTPCHPKGQVRVRGELWEAVCTEGAEAGTPVRVESVDGLTVTVRPCP